MPPAHATSTVPPRSASTRAPMPHPGFQWSELPSPGTWTLGADAARLAAPPLQDDLFGPLTPAAASWVPLVHDEECGIALRERVFEPAQAAGWMQTLIQGTAWQTARRAMYDRIVDVPRAMATIALKEVDSALGEVLRAMAATVAPLVAEAFGARMEASAQQSSPAERLRQNALPAFTHAGLNLYRDGRDSVAMHQDRLENLQEGAPIAIVSLGAVRRMRIAPQPAAPRASTTRAISVDLHPGSILLMSHASQRTHLHGIPKTSAAVEPRISVALRSRKA